jgi:microcystin-dependent protein
MTIAIKHAFVSLKGDGTDATQVQPSNWNATHSTSMATGNLLGRLSAGAGVFEEIPISAYMATLLSAADQNALAGLLGLFETGDVKYTFKTAAANGWLLIQGGAALTIGNVGSGATLRANADTLALYTLMWNNVSQTFAFVSGGRGASAAADFAALKTMFIPSLTGRSPIGAGPATQGLSAYTLGANPGEENHVLAQTEMPAHFHGVGISDPGHTHVQPALFNGGPTGVGVGGGGSFGFAFTGSSNSATTGVRCTSGNGLDTTDTRGSSVAHNTIHPVLAMNVMIKL